MGPGNPLAAALRATREYLISHGGFDPAQSGEPYPLLLVRPDGIAAYYAARAAMKSWGTDFGYELIDDDWKLAFPRPDPQLAQVVGQALQSARARQQRLIAAAPRSYSSRSRPTYRAAPGIGGSLLDSGAPGEDDGGFQPRMPAGPVGNHYGPYGGGFAGAGYNSPGGQPAGDGTGSPGGGQLGSPGGSLTPDRYGASLGRGGGYPQGSSGGGDSADPSGTASAGAANARHGFAGGSSAASEYASAGKGPKEQMPRPEGVLTIGPPSEPPPSSSGQRPASGDQQAMLLRPGEWYPKETPPKMEKPPKKESSREKSPKRDKSLAATRGKDWGLPDAASGSVPITRPIHIECEVDRLVIVPEKGLSGGKVILLGSRSEESMDEFISAIWTHMRSWGIAGKAMYWRPVLEVHVAADAGQRCRDLETLLEGSGLSIQRKE
jgi:hypothetical protein